MDYSFILVLLLFYKRISDQWKLEFEKTRKELIEEGCGPEEARELAKEKFFHQFALMSCNSKSLHVLPSASSFLTYCNALSTTPLNLGLLRND